MFATLSSVGKKYMFEQTDLKIVKKHKNDENCLILTIMDNNKGRKKTFNVLGFNRYTNDNAVLVTDLKNIETDVGYSKGIYIAICEEVIARFINLIKLANHKKLTIFTEDPFIQEILLKNKFHITKTGTSVSTGVVASKEF